MKTRRNAVSAVSAVLAVGLIAPVVMSPARAAGGDPTPTPTTSPTPAPTADPTPAPTPTDPTKPMPEVERREVKFSLSPRGSGPVGVGQLVTLQFSRAVKDKAAVERAVTVTSATPLPVGAWGWVGNRTAIYRPKTFWPGQASIRFQVDLNNVVLGSKKVNKRRYIEYVGSGNRQYVLTTARRQIITIRDSAHRLFVQRGGKILRSFPVSLGKPGYETRSGIKILTKEKYVSLRMTGTDRLTGERWDVRAPYSMRLTPTGEFIHGAPWARYRLGKYNGSHGCTNMAVGDAKWIFNHVIAGDPVVTTGTGKRMEVTNGTPGSYWNYRFRQWRAKSALSRGHQKGKFVVRAASTGSAPSQVAGP